MQGLLPEVKQELEKFFAATDELEAKTLKSLGAGDLTKSKPIIVLINGGSASRPPKSWRARSKITGVRP